MISACSSRGWRAFNDVEPAHVLPGLTNTSSFSKVACILQHPRLTREKISVDRKNAIRFIKVVDGINWLSESHHRTRASVVVIYRLVLMPLCLGKLGQYCLELGAQCWR